MYFWVKLVAILLTLGDLAIGTDQKSLNPAERNSQISSLTLVPQSHSDFARMLKPAVPSKVHRQSVTSSISTWRSPSANHETIQGTGKKVKGVKSGNKKANKLAAIHDLTSKPKTDVELRGARRRSKRKRNQAIMALLLAYKLKFAALIPAITGGLILLVSTTALAGFFFALFAAVLGLKGH